MWSSASMRLRSASVAWMPSAPAVARMPKCMAVGEYHTSTSVSRSAGPPSTGAYRENPVSAAACCQTGSSSTPSMVTSASSRGAGTCNWRSTPEKAVAVRTAAAVATAADGPCAHAGFDTPASTTTITTTARRTQVR